MRKILRAAEATLGVIVVVTIFGIVVVMRMPSGQQRLLAMSIGAEYLGADGVVAQTTGNNCGPASLKMVFDHYAIAAALHEIDSAVVVTHRGASMLALKTFAESKQLAAHGWKLSYEEFERRRFPMILFVNNDHYIVADSVRGEAIFLRDPSIGRIKMTKRSLLNIWKGEALIFSSQQ